MAQSKERAARAAQMPALQTAIGPFQSGRCVMESPRGIANTSPRLEKSLARDPSHFVRRESCRRVCIIDDSLRFSPQVAYRSPPLYGLFDPVGQSEVGRPA